jgi:hypothetical protein
MLHWLAREPSSGSSRFDGGKRKSSTVVAASSCVNRITARRRMSGGKRRDFPVVKSRSVSALEKLSIH